MRYYIIAGEPSGDLHGGRLIDALKANDKEAEVRAWGGDQMQAKGAALAKHIKELAIMGITQVLMRLPTIFRNFRYAHQDIKVFDPDVIILIDYSGFNLRIAKWAKKEGYRVFYYISPQVWATRAGRVKKIKKYVDQLFSILPFEEAFYQKYNYPINYVGHPLLDEVKEYELQENFRSANQLDVAKPIIALLPGSRKQEVKAILGQMLKVIPHFPDYQFVIAGAPTLDRSFYMNFIGSANVELAEGQTYDLLANSHAALVTSGTATLETALFEVPQVVCYKTAPIFYWIVKQIIKIPYISLVNIIMKRELVRELIQGDLNEQDLKVALECVLDSAHRAKLGEGYAELKRLLGEQGAALRAASKMQQYLDEGKHKD